jgi:hypothetical protein
LRFASRRFQLVSDVRKFFDARPAVHSINANTPEKLPDPLSGNAASLSYFFHRFAKSEFVRHIFGSRITSRPHFFKRHLSPTLF